MAKSLSGLIMRTIELGVFPVLELVLPIYRFLTFVDDTLILADPSVDNLWTIKVILMGFKLASGLQVNLAKMSSIRINFDPIFLVSWGFSLLQDWVPTIPVPCSSFGSQPSVGRHLGTHSFHVIQDAKFLETYAF